MTKEGAQPSGADPVSMHRRVSIEFLENTQGFAVKVPQGQKDPGKGWDPKSNTVDKSRLTLHGIKEDPTCNLGVHLHGNLIDVDIDSDSPFLMAALDVFLPPCAHVWGRRSRPRTHRVYALRTDNFDPGNHPVLKRVQRIPEAAVELRGGHQMRGEYSLLPGSLHPDGETYEWADLGRARNSVSITDPELLLRAIRLAGAIAVLAPHWNEGIRNDLLKGLSGFLHRSWNIADGIDDESIFSLDKAGSERFIEVLLQVAGDDPADHQARIKTFHATWAKAEKGNPVTGATSIAEFTGDQTIVAKLYTLLMDNPDMARIEDFTSRFAIWQGPGIIIDMDNAKAGMMKPLSTRKQFTDSYGHIFVQIGEKKRLLADLLFSMSSTTRLAGLTFDPTGDRIVETREGRKVNQWAGYAIEPASGHVTDEEVQPFIHYIENIVANGDARVAKWVLDWLANIFQQPGKKPGTALVLIGKPGAGKSVLGHALIQPIIGAAHSSITNDISAVLTNFNVRFDNKLFIQCDEATSNRQKSAAAKMKSLITDPVMTIEPKGVDSYEKPNLLRFLYTSNDLEDAVFLPDGLADRRYTILHVSENWMNDLAYWEPFHEWTGTPGFPNKENLAKVHRWLLQRDIDWRLISRPVETEAKVKMQQHSMSALDAWIAAMVARGFPLGTQSHRHPMDAVPDPKYNGNMLMRDAWPVLVRYGTLAEDFALYGRQSGIRGVVPLNENQLIMALRDRGLITGELNGIKKKVKVYDERSNTTSIVQMRLREFPPFDAFATYLKERFGFAAVSDGYDGASAEQDGGDVSGGKAGQQEHGFDEPTTEF